MFMFSPLPPYFVPQRHCAHEEMAAHKAWRKGVWTILSTQLLTLHLTLAATWHMTEPWHHSLSAFGHFPITPPIRSTLYLYPRSRSLPLPPHLPLVPCSQRFVGISSPDLEIPRSCLPFGKEHCMGRRPVMSQGRVDKGSSPKCLHRALARRHSKGEGKLRDSRIVAGKVRHLGKTLCPLHHY